MGDGYFKSKNKKSRIEQLEEAAGITEPERPTPKQESVTQEPSGFVAPPYTGPRPWKGEKVPLQEGPLMPLSTLRKRSTRGSEAFSDKELKQGFRKVG